MRVYGVAYDIHGSEGCKVKMEFAYLVHTSKNVVVACLAGVYLVYTTGNITF